jgi:hypothetical protein
METQMKTIFAALASAALLAAPMASISTPAAAQAHGGGGFHGGGGGFHGGGGVHGGGGARGGGFRGGGFHDGGHDRGFRGGRGRGDGFVFLGLPYGDPFYDDDLYGYDDPYDNSSPSCGSWSWDASNARYDWIPC